MAVNGLIDAAKEEAPIPLRRIPTLQILNEQNLETLNRESINVDLLLFNAGITEPIVITRKKLTQWNENVFRHRVTSLTHRATQTLRATIRCVKIADFKFVAIAIGKNMPLSLSKNNPDID